MSLFSKAVPEGGWHVSLLCPMVDVTGMRIDGQIKGIFEIAIGERRTNGHLVKLIQHQLLVSCP